MNIAKANHTIKKLILQIQLVMTNCICSITQYIFTDKQKIQIFCNRANFVFNLLLIHHKYIF